MSARAHRGHGMPSAGEPLAHGELVLGEPERLRARVQLDPLGDEQVEHVGGDVLVVEGDDVAVLGEGVHGLGLGVVADRRAGHDERGAGVVGLGEHAQGHPQLGGGPGAHPGELATTDDADDREASGCATWGGHPARIATAGG